MVQYVGRIWDTGDNGVVHWLTGKMAEKGEQLCCERLARSSEAERGGARKMGGGAVYVA